MHTCAFSTASESGTSYKRGTHMGSAALGEAIKGMRSWAMNEGRVVQTPKAVNDVFGVRVFNDKVQQARLPKPAYKALRDTMTNGTPLDLSTALKRSEGPTAEPQ